MTLLKEFDPTLARAFPRRIVQIDRLVRNLHRAAEAHRWDALTDTELLERFRSDPSALEAIVRRHGARVLAACRKVLSDSADVEDAFQATFLVLLRGATGIRNGESLGGWLYGVAHRIAMQARSRSCRRARAESRMTPRSSEESDLGWREACAILHEELDRLPDHHRLPLLLCYLEGKSRDEAAGLLGCTVGSLRGRLERGREQLRDRLMRRGITLSVGLLAAVANSVTGGVPPEPLIHLTLAAADKALGQSALVHGVSSMILAHKKLAMALVVLLTLIGVGVAWPRQSIPTGDKPTAENKKPAKPVAKPDADPPAAVSVSGRVLGPDGKPVAGAKLFVPKLKTARPVVETDMAVTRVGTTGADGRFTVRIPLPGSAPRSYLVAWSPGFGVDWLELTGSKAPPGEQTLRLPRDVPITGRVVNTEGKPVSGVSVSALSVYVPADEKLDNYLAGWKKDLRDVMSTPKKRLYLPLPLITGSVTTDKDGRFTIRGAGAERIVHLLFQGAGIARSQPWVITRRGFDPKPYNDVLLQKEYEDLRVLNRFLGLLGPDPTFVAEPGRQVSGVVTDGVTGKSVPDCALYSHTGFGDGVTARSDSRGRYVLAGLPKNARGYSVSVMPPKGKGYLRSTAHSNDTAGFAPIRLDIRLAQGSVIVGRVIDKQTGKGVSAGIRFAPLPDNKFFGKKPEYNGYRSDRTMSGTDKDGRFRLTTIPGRSLILVQVHSGEKFDGQHLNPYRNAEPDPDHKDLFKYDKDDDSWTVVTAGPSLEFLAIENTIKVIDVKESGETKVELFVDRGLTGQVVVQDSEGKPLAGAWVAGLAHHWPITYQMPTATATVYALNPKRPRTLVVYHPDKQLGGTCIIRGDEKGPVAARLAPLARVSGRLLDADGEPLAGAAMSVNAQTGTARELYRFAQPSGKPAVTDKDGRFTLLGVVPGIKFFLQIRKGEHYYGGKPKIGVLDLKPGGKLDLGNRAVELLR